MQKTWEVYLGCNEKMGQISLNNGMQSDWLPSKDDEIILMFFNSGLKDMELTLL